MRYLIYIVIIVVTSLAPDLAAANVVIHEIAWMGTVENANAEWIELYNDGAAVDVSGWILAATDGQPSVALSGSIGAQQYVLLERTSDDTVPGVTAWQIYTGAMGNAGEVLVLTDPSGNVVDQVDGSGDWAIGGDNATKLTLQRTAGGWVTAEPTPGRGNATSDDATFVEQQEKNTRKETASDAGTGVTKNNPTGATKKTTPAPTPSVPTVSLVIGPDVTVAAGVPHTFVAVVRKEGGVPFVPDSVRWNFGDGATGSGNEEVHTYRYSGDYVVNASTVRTVGRTPLTAHDQLVVRVVPLAFTISHADSESIAVTNESAYEVDLSGFALVAGQGYFRIPRGTTLLKGASIRFAGAITKLQVSDPQSVGIFTPGNQLVAQYAHQDTGGELLAQPGGTDEDFPEAVPTSRTEGTEDSRVASGKSNVRTEPDVGPESPETDGTGFLPATVAFAKTAQANESRPISFGWWIVGLLALIGTTVTGVMLARHERSEIIEGYVVESDE